MLSTFTLYSCITSLTSLSLVLWVSVLALLYSTQLVPLSNISVKTIGAPCLLQCSICYSLLGQSVNGGRYGNLILRVDPLLSLICKSVLFLFALSSGKKKTKQPTLINSWLCEATDLKLRTEEFIMRNPFPLIMMFLSAATFAIHPCAQYHTRKTISLPQVFITFK